MQAQENVKGLIETAAKRAGTKTNLAKTLGVTPQRINAWMTGAQPCTAPDRAVLAAIAGQDAQQELVRATLEKTAGTLRGEQLKRLLGKLLPQTGAAAVTVLLGLSSATFLSLISLDLLRCIKRQPHNYSV